MPLRLDMSESDFDARFKAMLGARREVAENVDEQVRVIIDDVRKRGDEALIELSLKFDSIDLEEAGIRVKSDEIALALEMADADTVAALRFAARRIEALHVRQKPKNDRFTDDEGVELGARWLPVSAAGLYVPGGTAAYPSSVLMNAIPARVAGVKRIAMVVPSPGGSLNPLVLAAANIAGIDEIYRIGGAQGVAALAYGTKTIAPVDKIVGPGNAYVAAAKRQVFGQVGIDMIAGPSEVLIIADNGNDPDWIAADLLAQAEHDVSAQSILITDDVKFSEEVERAVLRQLETLPRRDIASRSWQTFGAVIIVPDLDEATALANEIAPEHLEIATREPEEFGDRVTNAGAIFLGRYTPEAIGDYVAGTNHVLPTARSARFSSGLGVLDFMKRTSIVRCNADSLHRLAGAAITLGKAEGLDAHARSVAIRLNNFS